MKEAYNLEGELVEVPLDTPTKTTSQGRKLLTPEEILEIKSEQDDYAEKERKTAYIMKRNKERGSLESQLEYIVENGVKAFIDRDKKIRLKYPKGE